MFQSKMRSGMALIMAMLLLCATSLVHAEDAYMTRGTTRGDSDVSAETIIADGLILKPAGVVATIVGSALFVVTLPFSVPTRSVDKAAQKLVVDPARYTFVRPLGQVESSRPPTR
jgi:hypothetical protein